MCMHIYIHIMIPERGPQTVFFWGGGAIYVMQSVLCNLCYAIFAAMYAMQSMLCNLCYAIYAKRNMLKNMFDKIKNVNNKKNEILI